MNDRRINWKRTLLVCVGVLIVAAAVTFAIFVTEPTAGRSGAFRQTAMLVDVMEVRSGSFRPVITAMGTVEPSQDIILSPRVSGEVTSLSRSFTPGGRVARGDVLLRIDRADYENVLLQRRSDLSQAIADLNVELGRQQVARRDFELLADTLSSENRSLVLREPQLDAARSRVEAQRAAVRQAELDLERTTIRAPFDAHIISRNVNVGSQVATGAELARLVGVETYWVIVTVPLSQLRRIEVGGAAGSVGSAVLIRNRTAWSDGEYREGRVYQLIGALEEQTRMARLLVSVSDPLSYLRKNADAPPLIIGSFVEADIEGKELEDVFRLSRDYVRGDDTVWIMEHGLLRVRLVDIVFQDAENAYVRSGLADGDSVVTSSLSTVVDGAPLRVAVSDSLSDRGSLPQTGP